MVFMLYSFQLMNTNHKFYNIKFFHKKKCLVTLLYQGVSKEFPMFFNRNYKYF